MNTVWMEKAPLLSHSHCKKPLLGLSTRVHSHFPPLPSSRSVCLTTYCDARGGWTLACMRPRLCPSSWKSVSAVMPYGP